MLNDSKANHANTSVLFQILAKGKKLLMRGNDFQAGAYGEFMRRGFVGPFYFTLKFQWFPVSIRKINLYFFAAGVIR